MVKKCQRVHEGEEFTNERMPQDMGTFFYVKTAFLQGPES